MSLPEITAGTIISVYGTDSSDAVAYYYTPSVGWIITNSGFTGFLNGVNAERTRRGWSQINGYFSGTINASDINFLKSAIEVAGPAASQAYNVNGSLTVVTYPQAPIPSGFPGVTVGELITASKIQLITDELFNAGQVCTCNCNYCTCNCNYCTCNCNYSCTCNCNYS